MKATPLVSVIVPVRNDAAHLRDCLSGLRASTLEDYELIVVDDASTDDSARVAEETGARLQRLPARCGPAGARNHGALQARGRYLFFVDADVRVRPETLARAIAVFENDPGVAALFGSYDTRPAAPGFLSQYKNLFHHFVHQQGRDEASTFWSGCGAIRRDVFLGSGGFAARYRRPSIEDIELGVRLRRAGRRIVLRKDLQVTHLKRWTLWSLLKSDLWARAVPWTRLLLEQRQVPNDLNLQAGQRLSGLLAYALLATAALGLWRWPWLSWVALASLSAILALNWRLYAFFFHERGAAFLSLALPMHVLYFFYSGIGLGLGLTLHLAERGLARFRRAAAPAAVSPQP